MHKSKIVLKMELNEGKENMAGKQYTKELGQTTATSLRLTQPYWSSGRVVVGDSWFGSIKTVSELLKKGIFSIMLVKTAYKHYPKALLH